MTIAPGTSPDNALLVLYAPRVPRGTQPVVGGHCGVPLHIYDLEPMGLEVSVYPYLGQQPNDEVALNLNVQLDIVSKLTQSENDTVTFYLPKKLLFPDFVNRLTFTVTRGSQNMGTSEPLEVLYNAIRPGKEDTDPGVEGHSRLVLLLPDAIKNGVGPDFPEAGAQVCVSYPYCRAYDVIRLNCNGHDVFHTVTGNQAPLPGSDTPVTVCFTVTRADLAGGDSPHFAFSYTVTDQLGNSPDSDSPWSASQIVDVDLAGTRLPAPILREILNDSADDPGIIDRDKLAGNPLSVIVLTGDPRFQVGDTIEATYTATIAGQPEVVPITGTVESDEFGQKKPCILQVANERVATSSVVTVVFVLKSKETVVASSKAATARVIGRDTITLDPPVPAANPVDPLAYPQGLTVQVSFAASLPGDQARLVLVDLMPDPPTFSDLPLDVNHQATFNLDARFLGAWHGTAVQFVWALIRGGKEIARSGPLVLNVNRMVDGDGRLPKPVILGHEGPELDVNKLVATDKSSIAQWLLQMAGQYVWLRYDGYNSSGAPVFFDDLNGVPHNEAQGLARPIGQALVDWLKALRHGSAVTITFRVNFARNSDPARAVAFPVRTYTVKAAVELGPEIYSIKDSNGVEIPHGTYTFDNKVTIKGTAQVGRDVEIFDNAIPKGIATATSGLWTKEVSDLTLECHSFKAVARYGENQSTQPWDILVTRKLEIDNSRMSLGGLAYKEAPWTPRYDFPGNTDVRHASGGTPPYKYTSADERIARVSNVGKVEGFGRGTTMITVEDASGQKSGYEVAVHGTYKLYLSSSPMNYDEGTYWRQSLGSLNFNEPQSALLWAMYSMGFTTNIRTATGANIYGDFQRTRSGASVYGLRTDKLPTLALVAITVN